MLYYKSASQKQATKIISQKQGCGLTLVLANENFQNYSSLKVNPQAQYTMDITAQQRKYSMIHHNFPLVCSYSLQHQVYQSWVLEGQQSYPKAQQYESNIKPSELQCFRTVYYAQSQGENQEENDCQVEEYNKFKARFIIDDLSYNSLLEFLQHSIIQIDEDQSDQRKYIQFLFSQKFFAQDQYSDELNLKNEISSSASNNSIANLKMDQFLKEAYFLLNIEESSVMESIQSYFQQNEEHVVNINIVDTKIQSNDGSSELQINQNPLSLSEHLSQVLGINVFWLNRIKSFTRNPNMAQITICYSISVRIFFKRQLELSESLQIQRIRDCYLNEFRAQVKKQPSSGLVQCCSSVQSRRNADTPRLKTHLQQNISKTTPTLQVDGCMSQICSYRFELAEKLVRRNPFSSKMINYENAFRFVMAQPFCPRKSHQFCKFERQIEQLSKAQLIQYHSIVKAGTHSPRNTQLAITSIFLQAIFQLVLKSDTPNFRRQSLRVSSIALKHSSDQITLLLPLVTLTKPMPYLPQSPQSDKLMQQKLLESEYLRNLRIQQRYYEKEIAPQLPIRVTVNCVFLPQSCYHLQQGNRSQSSIDSIQLYQYQAEQHRSQLSESYSSLKQFDQTSELKQLSFLDGEQSQGRSQQQDCQSSVYLSSVSDNNSSNFQGLQRSQPVFDQQGSRQDLHQFLPSQFDIAQISVEQSYSSNSYEKSFSQNSFGSNIQIQNLLSPQSSNDNRISAELSRIRLQISQQPIQASDTKFSIGNIGSETQGQEMQDFWDIPDGDWVISDPQNYCRDKPRVGREEFSKDHFMEVIDLIEKQKSVSENNVQAQNNVQGQLYHQLHLDSASQVNIQLTPIEVGQTSHGRWLGSLQQNLEHPNQPFADISSIQHREQDAQQSCFQLELFDEEVRSQSFEQSSIISMQYSKSDSTNEA